MVRERLGGKVVILHLPLGSGELFTGMIDLVRQVEIVFDQESMGKKFVEGPIPDALQDRVKAQRHELIEAVAEFDDDVLHKYLEGEEPTEAELRRCIRVGTVTNRIVPVLAGAAFKNKGVQQLLDAVVDFLP
jgi:elongation factor G